MLKQCPRCRLCVEVEAPACCRLCGTELADMPPGPPLDHSAPHEVFEDAPTRKRSSP